jgi:betaine-aldehyde dehydrogenase
VVAAIVPWNFPFLMSCWKVAPALAAGCTMVLKPSELTPLSALALAEIIADAGVPNGVFNVVTGFGPDAGKPLAAHGGIDKIAFTGSVPTGSALMQQAALDIKRVSLELGGKSPFVVFEDADLDRAAEWIMFGIFLNQGQVCAATSRVLIHHSIHDALVERVVARTRTIAIGAGSDSQTKLGPLISAAHREKVERFIAAGKAGGARLISGGQRPPRLNKGYFLEPTIFVDVPTDSSIWTDEIFGPVVAIRAFTNEEEAVRLANDSRFGLAAAVMSADEARTERVARALGAGIVWINCSQPAFVEVPWGGFKTSGIGRELGRWGYENFLEPKQITRFEADEALGWY